MRVYVGFSVYIEEEVDVGGRARAGNRVLCLDGGGIRGLIQIEVLSLVCVHVHVYTCLESRVSWVRVPPRAARFSFGKKKELSWLVLLCLSCTCLAPLIHV